MSSDDLTYLQDWYATNCDGDWEHDSVIRIETLDNPGWRVWVNISETELAGTLVTRTRVETSDEDWLDYQCDGEVFDAACGPRGLADALAAFRAMSQSSSDPES